MKVNRFSHRQDGSGPIARERLKLMAESAPFEHSPAADDYEIRVVLKQNRKRA